MFQSLFQKTKELIKRVTETDTLRRILMNSGYLVTASGFTAGLGMVQGIFVARLIGPAGLGLYGAIKTLSNSANRFTSFRINEMTVRYVRYFEEENQKDKAAAVFKLAAIFEILGATAAFLLIYYLAPFGIKYLVTPKTLDALSLDLKTIANFFVLYGVTLLFNFIYDSSTGLLQVFNKFKEQAIVTAIQGVLTLLLILVVFFSHGGFMGVLIAYIIGKIFGAVIITILALITATKEFGNRWFFTPLSVLKNHYKSLVSFAFSTNLSSTVSLIAKDSESLWANALLGNEVAGFYELARNLIGILQIPISPLPNTTYPELAREAANKNWEQVRYILNRGSRLAALYSLPVSLGLIIFGHWGIGFVYGQEFLPAFSLLMILLAGYFFVNIFFWNRVALLALNRPIFPTIINFFGMIIKVAGTFLLVPLYQSFAMASLLSFYYIFTILAAGLRVFQDIRHRERNPDPLSSVG